ncbi:MAG: AAA family ATPase [Pseudomonadota bacterium]
MQLSDIKLGQTTELPASTSHGPVQVVAVTGGKGGTGKTNIAVNLAQALANQGKKTLLLDADLGMANVDVLLGLTATHTLFDVLNGMCRLEDIMIKVHDNLQVIPAASGIKQLADMGQQECAGLVRAFSDLKHPLDFLLVDTATGISESVASFCRAATEVLVVICNEPSSIRDSVAQIRLLSSEYGVTRFRVLGNRVASAYEAQELFQNVISRFTDNHNPQISFSGYIPNDEKLRKAVSQHRGVVDAYPQSRAAMAFKNLAGRVAGWPQPVRAGGHVEFFVERLIVNENMEMEVMS